MTVDGATLRYGSTNPDESDVRARLGPLPARSVTARLTCEPTTARAEITLQADDRPPVRCTFSHVVPYYSGGNGLEVGAAPLSPVSPDPAASRRFTGDFPAVVFTFDDRAVPTEPDATRQLAAWVAAD